MKKCELVKRELIAVEQAAWWHPRLRRSLKAAPLVVLFLLLNNRPVRAACSSNPAPDPAVDGSANSLRAAIQMANASGQDCTIRLQAGTYTLSIKNTNGQENAAAQGDLDITDAGHTVTVQGQGSGVSIVNAGGAKGIDDRVFQVLGGANATFRGLTIEGGVANDNGVAGTQSGATESDGGGILVQDGGHVSLSNVVLSGNQATGGTSQAAAGGGLYLLSGSANLFRSALSGNSANGGNGAGGNVSFTCPHSPPSAPTCFPIGETFSTPGGQGSGGGLYLVSGSATLSKSTVSGNYARGGSGGGGYYDGGEGPSPRASVGGSAQGSGIFISGGKISLTNSTLVANQAQSGPGGATFCSPNTRFCHDTGGDAAGGGLYLSGGSLALTGATIASNQALATYLATPGEYPPGVSSGGGIANADTTSLIIDSTLVGNNTQDSGNASNGDDVLGAITSSYSLIGQTTGATITDNGNNVFDVDPLLDPLGLRWNGGPTNTVALQTGSPAIDIGDNATCSAPQPAGLGAFDQRGYARFPRGDNHCDIGAFEYYNLLVYPQGGQFGPLPVGQPSQSRSFTITNNQTASVTLSTSLSGVNPADFVENSACGTTLAANASCTIKVAFKPTAAGARSAVLLATDSPDRTSPYTVKLTGTGK